MTRQDLSGIHPTPNNVLVKLDRLQDEFKMQDGKKFYIDTSYEPEKHAPITGHIIAICDSLYFSTRPAVSHSMPWKTDIELKVGDYIVSYYLTSTNASTIKDGRMLRDDHGDYYIFLKYHNIFAAKRDNWKIITCNGFNLLTPVDDVEVDTLSQRLEKIGLHTPRMMRGKHSNRMARVLYPARPLQQYRDPRFSDHQDELLCGDLVLIRGNAAIPLEYEYHASLLGRQKLYRVQRYYIYAKVDE